MQDIIDVQKPEKKKDGERGRRTLRKTQVAWLVVVVVLIASIGTAIYFKKEVDKVKSDPTAAQVEKNQAETDRVMTALKKVLFVSEQDAPTVARVEDPEKLKSSNKEFYKDVQVGDYLIIFPKRAVIYRESNNQIINLAPIINTADLKASTGTTPASNTQNGTE